MRLHFKVDLSQSYFSAIGYVEAARLATTGADTVHLNFPLLDVSNTGGEFPCVEQEYVYVAI